MDKFERERDRQKVLDKRRLQEELLKNSILRPPMVQVGAAQDLDVNGKCGRVSNLKYQFEVSMKMIQEKAFILAV